MYYLYISYITMCIIYNSLRQCHAWLGGPSNPVWLDYLTLIRRWSCEDTETPVQGARETYGKIGVIHFSVPR